MATLKALEMFNLLKGLSIEKKAKKLKPAMKLGKKSKMC